MREWKSFRISDSVMYCVLPLHWHIVKVHTDMSILPACSNSTAMFLSSKMRVSEELECLAICFSGTTARSGPLFGSRAAVSCLNHFVPESRSYHVSSFHMFKFKRVSMTFLSFHVVMMFDTFLDRSYHFPNQKNAQKSFFMVSLARDYPND